MSREGNWLLRETVKQCWRTKRSRYAHNKKPHRVPSDHPTTCHTEGITNRRRTHFRTFSKLNHALLMPGLWWQRTVALDLELEDRSPQSFLLHLKNCTSFSEKNIFDLCKRERTILIWLIAIYDYWICQTRRCLLDGQFHVTMSTRPNLPRRYRRDKSYHASSFSVIIHLREQGWKGLSQGTVFYKMHDGKHSRIWVTQEELQVDNGAYTSFHKTLSRNKTMKNLRDCGILITWLQGKNPKPWTY